MISSLYPVPVPLARKMALQSVFDASVHSHGRMWTMEERNFWKKIKFVDLEERSPTLPTLPRIIIIRPPRGIDMGGKTKRLRENQFK